MRKLTLSGPAAAVLLMAGLFENNIETAQGDGAIASWLQGHGNVLWMSHATLTVLGGVLLLVYAQVLRSRLSGTDAGPLERSVGALGTLVATMMAVGGAIFAAVPVGRMFEDAPDPSAAVYRYLSPPPPACWSSSCPCPVRPCADARRHSDCAAARCLGGSPTPGSCSRC